MKRQTKYTHLTERCSSIIKAFASLQIEQQTGNTVRIDVLEFSILLIL